VMVCMKSCIFLVTRFIRLDSRLCDVMLEKVFDFQKKHRCF
jgi:hypothetical protein